MKELETMEVLHAVSYLNAEVQDPPDGQFLKSDRGVLLWRKIQVL